jgi:cytochrome c553
VKKILFVLLVVVIAASMVMAQPGLNKGTTNYVPATDVQGAHENGGRGCAGCHAPHSGGRGAGGQTNGTPAANGVVLGDSGLWGTDTTAITASGVSLNFDGYTASLAGLTWASGSMYTGVATCLSCHDGNLSKGAMMSGQAYEQSFGLLNFATNVGSNGQATAVNLYGSAPIPTLLGNDGGVVGDYSNDHPVGPMANLGKVAAAALGNGLTYTVNTTTNKLTMVVTAGTTYGNFVAAYGTPAISSLADAGNGIAGQQYVVCTTCHNQHVQNVYGGGGYGVVSIAGLSTNAKFATIFYVNGPYNPGAPYDLTHVPSTNAFCLQCHFNHSSQYFGSTTVGTAF